MKKLVNLVWSITCLYLNLEREFTSGNLLGLTEQPALDSVETAYIVVRETKIPESHEPTNIEIPRANI